MQHHVAVERIYRPLDRFDPVDQAINTRATADRTPVGMG
jgi:hypothetical protein